MIVKVFGVYDSKAEAYKAPFCLAAVGQGIRMFADAINDPQVEFSKHPGDYVLYLIAEFDDNSGEYKNIVPPTHLGIGSDFVERKSVVSMPRMPGDQVAVMENGK